MDDDKIKVYETPTSKNDLKSERKFQKSKPKEEDSKEVKFRSVLVERMIEDGVIRIDKAKTFRNDMQVNTPIESPFYIMSIKAKIAKQQKEKENEKNKENGKDKDE